MRLNSRCLGRSFLVLVLCASGRAQHPMHDSPPPQPTPPPQIVKENPNADHSQFKPTAKLPHVPDHVSVTMREVIAQQRRVWQPDAVVTRIEFHWFPWDGLPLEYSLQFSVYSPSKGIGRIVWRGGAQNGQVMEQGSLKNYNYDGRPLSDFKVDLPDALRVAKDIGAKGPYFQIFMWTAGATGKPPVQIWEVQETATVPSWDRSFPEARLPVNAQTGKMIPYFAAYDPRPGSDAELREAWQAFMRRMSPQQRQNDVGTCADQIQGGQTSCYIPPE